MREQAVTAVQALLAESPRFRPVRACEAGAFDLYELAAAAEQVLGEFIDPDDDYPHRLAQIKTRLSWRGPGAWSPLRWRSCYWLTELGSARPVGTVAVEDWLAGTDTVKVSSLYVRPAWRGRGHGTAALEQVYRAATACGLHGLRLDTEWAWPLAVDYHLRRGYWLGSWKHCLTFTRTSYLPRYRIRRPGDSGSLVFAVETESGPTDLITATAVGGRLVLAESAEFEALTAQRHVLARYVPPTLSVHLAVLRWPLVRSAAHEARAAEGWWCDSGWPEGLRLRIAASAGS